MPSAELDLSLLSLLLNTPREFMTEENRKLVDKLIKQIISSYINKEKS